MITMIKATPSFYKSIYSGTLIPDKDLDRYLNQAAEEVFTLTSARSNEERTTDFEKNQTRKAICALAEFNFNNGGIDIPGVSSFSINGMTITAKEDGNINQALEVIKKYLKVTNLLNRNL